MPSHPGASTKRVTINRHPKLPSLLSQDRSDRGALEDGTGTAGPALHYGHAAIQPGLNELLQGNRKSIK